MTIGELQTNSKEVLTCREVAPILKVNQWTLHQAAVKSPETLGFPVIVIGSRVMIPRIPFLRFMGVIV